jgi:hypothetical protein
MLVAVLLPVLIGLFLLATEPVEARVFGPPDEDAGGPGPRGSVEPTARGHIRTALQRAAACWGAKVHGDRHSGNGADIDRQGSGRPIEGHGPWTHR